MKSIKQQYIDLKEGKMTQAQFMRNIRMTMPHFITNITSFSDTVKILKNKGILNEDQSKSYGTDTSKLSYTEVNGPAFKGKKGYDDSSDSYIKEVGFTNGPANSDEVLLSIITKYISDPDEAQQELEAYRQKGYTGFSDPLIANLARDEEFQSWVQQGHDEETLEKEIGEAELNEDPVGQQAAGDPDEEAELRATLIKKPEGKKEEINEIKNRISSEQAHPHELRMGIRIEMEHTNDPKKAEQIALDHLTENPFYYTMLKLSGADSNISEKPKVKQEKKKDETCLVDKKNGMKPVKGVEKPKASANKAKKETIKGQSISLMSLIAKSVRGVKKMEPTGEKMKKVKIKEMIFKDLPADSNKYNIQKDVKGRIMQATNDEGVKFSVNDEAIAIDNGEKIKIKSFIEQQGKVKAIYNKNLLASTIDIDGLKKDPSIKGNLGSSFDKFKDQLKEIIRKELKEMYDGRDNVTDVTGETGFTTDFWNNQ